MRKLKKKKTPPPPSCLLKKVKNFYNSTNRSLRCCPSFLSLSINVGGSSSDQLNSSPPALPYGNGKWRSPFVKIILTRNLRRRFRRTRGRRKSKEEVITQKKKSTEAQCPGSRRRPPSTNPRLSTTNT